MNTWKVQLVKLNEILNEACFKYFINHENLCFDTSKKLALMI